MKKRIPIGIDDYKDLMTQGCYYVDKTLLVKEIFDAGGKITLLPRPRRFGKTLNLSMMQYFFDPSIHSASLKASQNTRDERGTSINPVMVSDHCQVIVSNHEFDERVVILEFKVRDSSQQALQQIKDRGYAEAFRGSGKQLLGVGLQFDAEKRNLADDWVIEEL